MRLTESPKSHGSANRNRLSDWLHSKRRNESAKGIARVVTESSLWPSVSRLLLGSGPSAVAWLVIPAVVNAVNRRSKWSLSHVRQKVFERLAPPIADSYAPASIQFPNQGVLVCAALHHVGPTSISTGPTHCVLSGRLVTKTTTALAPSVHKAFRHHVFGLSAVARSDKSTLPRLCVCGAINDRPAADSAAKLNRDRMRFNHLPNLLNRLVSGQRPRRVPSTARLRSFYAVDAYSGANA